MKLTRLLLLPVLAASCHAVPIGSVNYAAPTTAILGSGNPNGSWTAATNGNADVELRMKERGTTNMTNNGAGTYMFALGTNANFEFSLGSGTQFLSDFQYVLRIDTDPSLAQNFTFSFDPLALYGDNSFGTSSTLNGAGVEGLASALAGSNSIAQNSQRDIWYGLNHNINSTYSFELTAYSANDSTHSNPLARTEANLQFGTGGTSVPDSGSTLALLGSAFIGMMGFSKLKNKRA